MAVHGRHTHPAPLERGDLKYSFLVGNERFVVLCVSPLERGLRGVLRREARAGKKYCNVVFLELRVDVFDFRRLCSGVTHPRPLSRGEIGVQLSS